MVWTHTLKVFPPSPLDIHQHQFPAYPLLPHVLVHSIAVAQRVGTGLHGPERTKPEACVGEALAWL